MDPTLSVFNAFDLLLIVTIGFSMIVGFSRGFIRESLNLSAWLGAFWLMMQNYQWPQSLFHIWIQDAVLLKIASHFFVFCLFLTIFLCIAQWLSRLIQNSFMQSVDHSLGLVFGLVRAMGIICALYLASWLFILPDRQPILIRSSKSYTWLNKGALFMASVIPASWKDQPMLLKGIQCLQQNYSPNIVDLLSAPQPRQEGSITQPASSDTSDLASPEKKQQ